MALGDTLFAMTEWLRTTWVVDFSLWVSEQPLCLWLQSHFLAIPIFQSIHILMIALLFGATLMLNLRVVGVSGASQSLADAGRLYRPWIWYSLLGLIVSGVVLLISEPVRNMVNPIFWLKMGALMVTILLTLLFHTVIRKRQAKWEAMPNGAPLVRASAVALILLLCVVITGGRWIAYAPV